MRIYTNPLEAIKETERELWEMGIEVQPQTMQDKHVGDNPDYLTKEIRGYAFKIVDWTWNLAVLKKMMVHFFGSEADDALTYVLTEFEERVSGKARNPGKSYLCRKELWEEYLHDGKFAYTYSERITPQLETILEELRKNPETRQAIINIHSNISAVPGRNAVLATGIYKGQDLYSLGGGGRVPCSICYQLMIREGKMDLIYTMRSCDFITHFSVDICLALLLQDWFTDKLNLGIGTFTYFVGSLHAYQKDLKEKGIF